MPPGQKAAAIGAPSIWDFARPDGAFIEKERVSHPAAALSPKKPTRSTNATEPYRHDSIYPVDSFPDIASMSNEALQAFLDLLMTEQRSLARRTWTGPTSFASFTESSTSCAPNS